MSAQPSVPPAKAPATPTVAALVYADEAYPDAVFARLVAICRGRGLSLGGVLQHRVSDCADHHCDVELEDLASGVRTIIFEERGAGARGCRLDVGALADATARIERSLDIDPALLLLNKFGKVETEGGGLIGLIGQAIERGIPVIIGVPTRNLAAWRAFAGDLAVELGDEAAALRWLDAVTPAREAAE